MRKNVRRVARRFHYVYYAKHPVSGLIKIGRSLRPGRRLREVARVEGVKTVRLVGVEVSHDEYGRHKHFKRFRVRGEWFSPAPELLGYIALLGKTPYAARHRSINQAHKMKMYLTSGKE